MEKQQEVNNNVKSQKPKKVSKPAQKEVFAQARKLNITPRKAGLIVDLVRNKNAQESISILKYCNKLGAYDVIKVINSAVANAVNNFGMKADLLYIKSIFVTKGATLKRMHTRARGRSAAILKHSSNITVYVAERAK